MWHKSSNSNAIISWMQISLQALIQPIPHELMPVANVYKSDL